MKNKAKKTVSDRETVHHVETLHIKDTILKVSEQRHDDWGKIVNTRICNIADLVAAEVRYQSKCMKNFYTLPHGKKRGRPKSSTVSGAMNHAFTYLEENREECQFSFS